jgi:cold shock CspA family protein
MTQPRGRLRGRVVYFNAEVGYGRVRGDDGTSEFLHVREIAGRHIPVAGDYVWFDHGHYHQRPCAVNVHVDGADVDTQDKPASTKVPTIGDVFPAKLGGDFADR